jgi:alpha-galactosidase
VYTPGQRVQSGEPVELRLLAGGGLQLSVVGLDVSLRGLGPEVTSCEAGQERSWRPALRAIDGGFAAASVDGGLTVRLGAHAHAGALVVEAAVRNTGTRPLRLRRLAPLALDASGECRIGPRPDRWSVFRQGYQSWTGTRSFRVDEVDRDPASMLLKIGLIDVGRPSPQRRGDFRSDMLTVVQHLDSGEALVAGFLSCRRAFGSVEVRVDGQQCTRLAAVLDYDGIRLEPGQEITAEPLWLAAGTDAHALLAAYATAAGAAMRARVPARNPVGWCSWYYYFTAITEECILENLRALREVRARLRCDYVQVDDGYQADIGDWLATNEKFPRGMHWMAEQIRAAGFDAGIWTAPFIARRGSRLLAEHPDWFVKNRRGRPRFALWNPLWGARGNCYALDTTHPAVLDWLRGTFRTLVRDWGYRVLKLDFLFAAALPGYRHDPAATRAAALRRGLEAIRDGAGDDAFLLGCGCPLGPAIGIVDAMRIGPDVAPYWSNAFSRGPAHDLHGLATKHAIRNTLARAFTHRRWWLNDPDCLMVRDTRTQLTLDEVRSLATVIAVTDGMVVLSDRVEQLTAERLDVLMRAVQLAGGQSQVVDLMHADMPELLVARTAERSVVAAFNFDDRPRWREVDLTALGLEVTGEPLREWWTGAAVPVRGGRAQLGEVPAHGCRVLVRPKAAESGG